MRTTPDNYGPPFLKEPHSASIMLYLILAMSWYLTLLHHKPPFIVCFSLPLLYAISCWCLSLWSTLFGSNPIVVCFPPFVLQEESHQEIPKGQWTQAPGPTARPKYLATWHWPSDCFQRVQKERIQDPYTFCPVSPSPDCEPWLYDPLDSRWRGDRLLEAGTYCVLPSAGLRVKAIFLFAPNSVSANFIWLQWAEKTKILVSTMPSSLAVPHRPTRMTPANGDQEASCVTSLTPSSTLCWSGL